MKDLVEKLEAEAKAFMDRCKRDTLRMERQYNRGAAHGLLMAANMVQRAIEVEKANATSTND